DAPRRLPHPGPQGHAAAPGPHRRVDGGADPPLQDLHRGVQGPGRRDVRGGGEPPGRAWLLHRGGRVGPALPDAHPGRFVLQPSDAVDDGPRRTRGRRHRHHLQHRPDHGGRRPVIERAEEILARYPSKRSAMMPLLYEVAERDGYVTEAGMTEVAEHIGLTPAEVLGVCSFYSMFKRSPQGTLLVSVCTSVSCMVN